MTELLTAAQIRAIEQAAIARGEATGLELMERAGRGVVEAIFEEWPELAKTAHRAVVLCGPGNNGGDGFVVARLLKEWGWEVEVYLYGDPAKLPPDAKQNFAKWEEAGGEVVAGEGTFSRWLWEFDDLPFEHEADGIVIDALFGIGLHGNPDALFRLFERYLNPDRHWKVVAVDVPSLLDADSGRVFAPSPGPGPAEDWELFGADLTVTFHGPKIGHYIGDGPRQCHALRVVDIGLQPTELGPLFATPEVRLCGANNTSAKPGGHKYAHGHALVLSGPPGQGGAARLAARGALRIGAGLVTLGCPPAALTENAARLDAIMLRQVADADALARILEDRRINALCLGPGLGTGEREAGLAAAALGLGAGAPPPPSPPHKGEERRISAEGGPGDTAADPESRTGQSASPPPCGEGRGEGGRRRPIVLDADALTLLARHPGLFAALHENCVLTPHAGEFARLFPDIAEKLAAPATRGPAYSKLDATRAAAGRAGCTVLFKGPDTVIADPSGRAAISAAHYDRAAPWLATAGSGDVLTGFIAGLLARGLAPMQAAETAAWLHVECALSFGPGLIAEDLPEALPKVFRGLGL